jgi:hypothetical protein
LHAVDKRLVSHDIPGINLPMSADKGNPDSGKAKMQPAGALAGQSGTGIALAEILRY